MQAHRYLPKLDANDKRTLSINFCNPPQRNILLLFLRSSTTTLSRTCRIPNSSTNRFINLPCTTTIPLFKSGEPQHPLLFRHFLPCNAVNVASAQPSRIESLQRLETRATVGRGARADCTAHPTNESGFLGFCQLPLPWRRGTFQIPPSPAVISKRAQRRIGVNSVWKTITTKPNASGWVCIASVVGRQTAPSPTI